MWSRVGGDALDLALLGVTAARNPGRRTRTALAVANVAAVVVPDVSESIRLARKPRTPESGKRIRKAVTIHQPRTAVEAAWLGAVELRRKVEEAGASVSFAEAPGDRGPELAVDWRPRRERLVPVGRLPDRLHGR